MGLEHKDSHGGGAGHHGRGHHGEGHHGGGHHESHHGGGHHEEHHADNYISHEDLLKLGRDVGLKKHKWGYATKPLLSHQHVTEEGHEESEIAFSELTMIFDSRHQAGWPFDSYEDDYLIMFHAGADLVLHFIYEDGRHERHVLGDVQ